MLIRYLDQYRNCSKGDIDMLSSDLDQYQIALRLILIYGN
jgi:hypothetical protein